MSHLTSRCVHSSAVSVASIILILFGAVVARADLEISSSGEGAVQVLDSSTGVTVQRFETGPGKVRETFLIESETLAVISKIDRTTVWNVSSGELVRSHPRRIYAFAPDRRKFITYEPGEDGGLFVEDARTFQIVSTIYQGDRGGPVEMRFSADGRYLAVHFNSEYPVSDEQYPVPEFDHSVDWVEMFDLVDNLAIPEFHEKKSYFLGEFEGSAYYLRNKKILIGGEPWDEGLRFIPGERRWEPVKGEGRGIQKPEGSAAVLTYDVYATVLETDTKLGTVSIDTYDLWSDSNRVGCIIEGKFTPESTAPVCCANWWQAIVGTEHPLSNCGGNPGLLTVPYIDNLHTPQHPHPRYNYLSETQYGFYDRPARLKTNDTESWQAETWLGTEKGEWYKGTFYIPGTTAGFRWGFNWRQSDGTHTLKSITQGVVLTEAEMEEALGHTCFSQDNWDMKIAKDTNPCIEILKPVTANPAFVGPFTDPDEMKANVRVGPTFTSHVLSGLGASDFTVTVGGYGADVSTAVEKQLYYELTMMPPDSVDGIPKNDKYDMQVEAKNGTNLYNDKESLAVEYTDERSVSVALVIDRSGSMGYSGYMEPAKDAASQFVDLMLDNDQVSVVSFSSSAGVDFPLTTITSPQVKIDAQAAIAGIFSYGGTSIGSGMSTGQGQLDGAEDDHAHAQILLSDGQENEAPWIDDILPTIPQRTDIYTIALGPDADQAKLQQVATATGGQYFLAPSTSELQLIYNLIRGAVGGNQIISSAGGSVSQGSTSSSIIDIDDLIDILTFFLGWGGSDLDLTLVSPSGAIIDSAAAAADPNIEYKSASSYEYYIINSPEGGKWDARVYGKETTYSDEPEPYTMSVTGDTDLRIDGSFYNEDLQVQQPINLLVTLTNGATPVTGAVVVSDVTPPVFSSSSPYPSGNGDPPYFNTTHPLHPLASDSVITLLDDGAHGDGGADDGVYGAIYTNTTVPGSYIFNLHASGTTSTGDAYTRETLSSIFLNASSSDSTATIGGTINANISKTVYVRAWINDIQMTGQPDFMVEVDPGSGFPENWVLQDIPTGNYNIDAFLDRNGDGGFSENEPHAVYAASDTLSSFYVASGDSIMGIDFTLHAMTFSDTDSMRVFPNPYRPESTAEGITFDKLPLDASINIYTVAGELVRKGNVNDDALWLWDLKNNKGDQVARGVYIYFVDCHDCGGKKTGKVAVIR